MSEIGPKRQRGGNDVSTLQILPRAVHFLPSKEEGAGGAASWTGPPRIEVGLPRDVHKDSQACLCLSLPPRLRQRQRGRTFSSSAIYNSNPEMGPRREIGNNLAQLERH